MENFSEKLNDFMSGVDISIPLNLLTGRLPEKARFYVVGGALRNLLIRHIHGAAPDTADIDMVIGNLATGFSLETALTTERLKRGDFDGVKWWPENSKYSFDLSLLENFLPIKKFRLAPNLENLLDTIDFTVNALVYDVKKNKLHERNAFRAVEEKTIGFNSEKVYDIGFLAYRLLLIRHKIGFYPSREAFRFLRSALGLDDSIWIKNTLRSHHGEDFAEKVLEDYDRICSYNDYEEYKKREKPPYYLGNENNQGRVEPRPRPK